MKSLYVIVIYLIIFQITILIVGATGIFPNGFYSDFDTNELKNHAATPQGLISYLFVPSGTLNDWINRFGGGAEFIIPALVGVFITIGSVISFFTQSFAPISIAIVGLLFVPMITKSYGFFNKLFTYGDSQAMLYLGLLFGVLIFVIAIITIIEMPTHGRS